MLVRAVPHAEALPVLGQRCSVTGWRVMPSAFLVALRTHQIAGLQVHQPSCRGPAGRIVAFAHQSSRGNAFNGPEKHLSGFADMARRGGLSHQLLAQRLRLPAHLQQGLHGGHSQIGLRTRVVRRHVRLSQHAGG